MINGTTGPDVLNGTALADIFDGKAGNDKINGNDGTDIAIYAGHVNDYTIASLGTATIIIGKDTGTDTVDGVEIFRFKNGDFVKDASGLMVPYTEEADINRGPDAAKSQNLSTFAGVPLTVKVVAIDGDGDTLTFSALNPAKGSVTNSGGGQFTYTPNSGFAGYDSFKVTINDGNGGLATQTVNIGVAGNTTTGNQAPQTVATQLASTAVNTAVAIKMRPTIPMAIR